MPTSPGARASRNSSIRITNGALEEHGETIVLRGIIDPASLRNLKTGAYQREVLHSSLLSGLTEALMLGRTPDVILGMRGQHYTTRDSDFFLQDDVYIIDGLQRVEAARRMLGGQPPHLGALVYFSSNEAFEREQFNAVNTKSVKLSPNVLIRNMRHDKQGIAILYGLCQDKTFPLYERVTWNQSTRANDLISATTMLKAVGRLHMFLDIPGIGNHRIFELSDALEEVIKVVGKNVFRANVQTFFDVIDMAWGVRSVIHKKKATQLRYAFLFCLGSVFASHYDFWTGADKNRLLVIRPLVSKLSQFRVKDDEQIQSLANAGSGTASQMLRRLIVEHLDKGKRTGRLRPRHVIEDAEEKPVQATPLVNGGGEHHTVNGRGGEISAIEIRQEQKDRVV